MARVLSQILNEEECPVPVTQLAELGAAGPADTLAIAGNLPMERRAALARFCYNRTHLLELALRLAGTCDLISLEKYFGRAGRLVYEQSRNVEQTLSQLNRTAFHERKKEISLAGGIRRPTLVP